MGSRLKKEKEKWCLRMFTDVVKNHQILLICHFVLLAMLRGQPKCKYSFINQVTFNISEHLNNTLTSFVKTLHIENIFFLIKLTQCRSCFVFSCNNSCSHSWACTAWKPPCLLRPSCFSQPKGNVFMREVYAKKFSTGVWQDGRVAAIQE